MTSETSAISTKNSSRNWLQYLFSDWERTQLVISFLLIVLVGLISVLFNTPYVLGILILATLYAYVGITWNIVAGFAGQLLIAHVIFLGIGAYTTIVLNDRFGITPWLGIPAAGIVAGLLGVLISVITLRYGLKADYFALFTIALMVTLKTLFLKWKFVGASLGLWLQLSNTGWKNMIFATKQPYLYIIMGILALGIIVQYIIYRSKTGKYLLAIREDESAAAALGVNTSLYKTYAVVIGAVMAGIAGGFYVMYVNFVEPPQVFDLGFNVEIVMASPIIGGLGSLLGPIIGAFINKPLAELIRGLLTAETSGTSLIIYGSFLILSILFMPRGIAGVVQDVYLKLRRRSTDHLPGGS
ncbi:MAG: branched-chain amino acid ABC transporter permease [Anaerolineaceae bacterium]|nr:branched-chain amino acid ABC transporter permease [Anaerolineaceae bacterium]